MRAHAGERGDKERAAKTACLSGDYAKGVALLAELYVSTNDVIYLFNQGRCFEQNGKYEEAIVHFREYQRKNADVGNPSDSAADRHIAECQALLNKQRGPEGGAPRATPGAAPAAPALPVVAEKPATSARASEAVAPPSPGRGWRVAGITATAIGAAGIVTGVFLNLKANQLTSQLDAANNSSTTLYQRSAQAQQSHYETGGWVAYGAGAACLAGGAILYYLGYRQALLNEQVAVAPMFAAGELGAALQGAF
ncbi:MAG: hypothetical protein ABSB49_20140 [Polyangia bacterium]